MMKKMSTAVLMAAGSCATLLMALSPSTAHAASAGTISIQTRAVSAIPRIPYSASGCTYGSSGGNVHTCFSINGSGLVVNFMAMQSCVISSARTIHQEYSGPNLVINTKNVLVNPGQCLDSQPPFNRKVAPGTYCGTTWEFIGGTSYTNIGRVCFNVHS